MIIVRRRQSHCCGSMPVRFYLLPMAAAQEGIVMPQQAREKDEGIEKKRNRKEKNFSFYDIYGWQRPLGIVLPQQVRERDEGIERNRRFFCFLHTKGICPEGIALPQQARERDEGIERNRRFFCFLHTKASAQRGLFYHSRKGRKKRF